MKFVEMNHFECPKLKIIVKFDEHGFGSSDSRTKTVLKNYALSLNDLPYWYHSILTTTIYNY